MKSQQFKNPKKVITQIWTYDGDLYELDISIKDWLKKVTMDKKAGKKSIFLEKYQETLYFNNIKKEKGKVKFLELPEPKKEKPIALMGSQEKENFKNSNPDLYYKRLNQEKLAREKVQEQIKEHRKKAAEELKKKFILERNEILKRLALKEKQYGLTTTLQKIEYGEKYQKEQARKNYGRTNSSRP